MPAFSIYTLGCKLNQFESEAIADAFKRAGWELLPWDDAGCRELLIINTCTVTSKAEQKARRIIRRALEDQPQARVIVTGCYAQLDREAIAALEGAVPSGQSPRLLIIPGDQKSRLLDLPPCLATGEELVPPVRPLPAEAPEFRFNPENFSFHSRPFLKIQDGCDHRCSYCRVSLARGPSRSLGVEPILGILKKLEEQGAGEAVLTGVNLNQYRDQGHGLADLLAFLLGGTERISLRLSSLEPEGLTPALIETLAHPRIRPHFHISLQSGSPAILEKMRRPYGPEEVEQGISRLRTVKEDPFLACDIIAGFPGETGDDFEKTLDLCRRIGFAWIHAFPYSPRPGAEAYSFKNPVSERETAVRVETLLALSRQGRQTYLNRWLGRETEAVYEAPPQNIPGDPFPPGSALSANYLKLLVRLPPGALPSHSFRCRLLPLPQDAPLTFDAFAEVLPPSP